MSPIAIETFNFAKITIVSLETDPAGLIQNEEELNRQALRLSAEIPDELRAKLQLLKVNILSGLHIKGLFALDLPAITPSSMMDDSCDPSWWEAANVTATLCRAFDVQLCSYCAENDGKLFVHLVPMGGDSPGSRKSRSRMRGHTDGVALPFPGESCAYEDVAPSPDLVILVGMRNPRNVHTSIAPLSSIMRKLSGSSINTLMEPLFDFHPQASFSLAPQYVNFNKPILVRDQYHGYIIRFSHSKVLVSAQGGARAEAALSELKTAISNSSESIILGAGDVLLMNNRTALHGRGEVGEADGIMTRWLLRVYGMYSRPITYSAPGYPSYMLLPNSGGPI